MKKIEDYLHMYLGCEMILPSSESQNLHGKLIGIQKAHPFDIWQIEMPDGAVVDTEQGFWNDHFGHTKPILRPLSDMTREESYEFALMCMNANHHPEHIPVEEDEIQIEDVPNDGGNMLDDDVHFYIGLSCRCFEGGILFMKDGRIGIIEEDQPSSEMMPLDDIAEKVAYLLSKYFDLFGLIEAGLATTLTDKH